jgi:hypothetical protein
MRRGDGTAGALRVAMLFAASPAGAAGAVAAVQGLPAEPSFGQGSAFRSTARRFRARAARDRARGIGELTVLGRGLFAMPRGKRASVRVRLTTKKDGR